MLVGSVMHRKDMSFVNVRPVFRRQAAQDHGFQSFVRCDVRNHLLKRRLNQPCPPTRAKWIPVIAQLPLSNQPPHNLSYKIVCQQIASAIVELVECSEQRLLTVDFPPEKSETSAGTLVSRFENNMNMCEKILEALSVPRNSWSSVGGNVEIRDNINPQGGGEYLTDDECMTGIRAACPKLSGKSCVLLINAGVDGSTLRQVRDLDNGSDVVVLVNCNLDRLSFFTKLSVGRYIESFQIAYALKLVLGLGALLKRGSEKWKLYVLRAGECRLLEEFDEKPVAYKAEELVRVAAYSGP